MNLKSLCLNLVNCDSENEVVNLLKKNNLWNDEKNWRLFGDQENNFSTIGNQQSIPEGALVEKLINAVDANLILDCKRQGLNPESSKAPKCMADAVEQFYGATDGNLANVNSKIRTELAQKISLVATGSKTNPCITVVDKGEGQSPENLPETILSINKSNKLRIPFVQGKFNMGGTGSFQFCGKQNLQLIVTKRCPDAAKNNESLAWSFTVIRRFNPCDGVRSSTYRYLAPGGQVLNFDAENLPLLPGKFPEAYHEKLAYGTLIKMYEYKLPQKLKTNITFDLMYKLNLLLPKPGLPIRIYERRNHFSTDKTPQNNLNGLSVRIEENKRDNIEKGFPASSTITVKGEQLSVAIICFKEKKEKSYKNSEGIIYTINGQTHAFTSKEFFARKKVNMGFLKDSLLIMVDCSQLGAREVEDLFMNSRDRLRSGELKSVIESRLQDLIYNHEGLRKLREQRKRDQVHNRLNNDKPYADLLKNILTKFPTLSKLFVSGLRLQNPFKLTNVGTQKNFEGKEIPTFFKLEKEFPESKPKQRERDKSFRVKFSTDANNDFFDRTNSPGSLKLHCDNLLVTDYSMKLWNGKATLTIHPQNNTELSNYNLVLDCDLLANNIINEFHVETIEPRHTNTTSSNKQENTAASNNAGKDKKSADRLALPKTIEVIKDDENWSTHNFNDSTAIKHVEDDEGVYFFVNMSNIHLLTEIKSSKRESALLQSQYRTALVLLGLSLIKHTKECNIDDSQNYVATITSAISPMILPIIHSLGAIDL